MPPAKTPSKDRIDREGRAMEPPAQPHGSVAVVRARQDLEARVQSEQDGPDTVRAIELIDGVIKLLPA